MDGLKEQLISEYKKLGRPLSLDEFAKKLNVNLQTLEIKVKKVNPLDTLYGLTIGQALELINYYGEGFLFSKEIELIIHNYFETRMQINFIEKNKGLS